MRKWRGANKTDFRFPVRGVLLTLLFSDGGKRGRTGKKGRRRTSVLKPGRGFLSFSLKRRKKRKRRVLQAEIRKKGGRLPRTYLDQGSVFYQGRGKNTESNVKLTGKKKRGRFGGTLPKVRLSLA